MDKNILKGILNHSFTGYTNLINRKSMLNAFYKKIDDEHFLKIQDEVFTYNDHGKEITFIVLKDLTEKLSKIYENFIFAFEIITEKDYERIDFGFVVKEEDKYIKFDISDLEDFINFYHNKKNYLYFGQIKFIKNDEEKLSFLSSDSFNTDQIEYFKKTSYYNIFKNEYLDYYINSNNLKIRRLVTNIFD